VSERSTDHMTVDVGLFWLRQRPNFRNAVVFVAQHGGRIHLVIAWLVADIAAEKDIGFQACMVMATDGNRASPLAMAGLT